MFGAPLRVANAQAAAGGGAPATETFTVTPGATGNFDGYSDGSTGGGGDPGAVGSIDVGTIWDGSEVQIMGTNDQLGATLWVFIEGDHRDEISDIEIVGDTNGDPGTGTYDAGANHTEFYVGTVVQWAGGTEDVIITYA